MTPLRIVVYGFPAPQGSKAFKGMREGADGRSHGVLVEQSKKVKPWRKAVEDAARRAMVEDPTAFNCPVRVRMIFTLPKPKSAPKRTRTWPSKVPDLSKLVRSTEDALTDAGVWVDDSRVVECCAVKAYPNEHPEAMNLPGVVITIEEVTG